MKWHMNKAEAEDWHDCARAAERQSGPRGRGGLSHISHVALDRSLFCS